MKDDNNYKNILRKCDLCGRPMSVNEYDIGTCPHCNWTRTDLDEPHKIHYSYNFISFNKAKQLLKEGKPLKPTIGEFVECIHIYNEMEFQYGNKTYIVWLTKNSIEFGEDGNNEFHQTYISDEEFISKANINGILLKEIWNKIDKIQNA